MLRRDQRVLRRLQKLFQMSESLSRTTIPQIIHVAAVKGNSNDLNNLRTLDSSKIDLKEYGAKDDFFILSFFRAISSHVLTTGSNLRAESNVTYEPLPPDLLYLRGKWGLRNDGPTPVVMTKAAEGIDFNAPFFQRQHQGAVPILLVEEKHFEGVVSRMGDADCDAMADIFACKEDHIRTPSNVIDHLSSMIKCDSSTTASNYNTSYVTRMSVECGPSVTSKLYEDDRIDALSLSVLTATRDENNIPVIDNDPCFGNDRFLKWISNFEKISSDKPVDLLVENKMEETYRWEYNLYFRDKEQFNREMSRKKIDAAVFRPPPSRSIV